MFKGKGKRLAAMLLTAIMMLGTLPMSAFAAPASDIPSEMLDNDFLDALAYTGYNVQAQKDDGTIFKKYGYQLEGSSILSGITYDYTCSGLETNASGKPDIAAFRTGGLCCASDVSYVYFNYLPNVAGVDVSAVPRPANYRSASGLSAAADGWVSAGLSRRITFTQNSDGNNFVPSEEIPIGSLVVFKSIEEGNIAHVALYAGCYNGQYFLTHVGNDKGPEISTIVGMSKGGYPEAVFQVVTPPFTESDGTIEVYKKDPNGKNLSGAYFVATNQSDSSKQYRIGPTNSNGYAYLDKIPYGDYRVVETVFPTNYRSYGQTEWNVTVGKANNGVVTINAVNEEIPGSAKIVKTSEDGKVDGISFRIQGNGVDKTVQTKNGGQIQIDNLKPGVYTVTEQTENKYVPQESRSVTVVSGQTATVTFNNKLKRGDLTVTKTAEDGLSEGAKFHLYGTSLSGLAVNEYAVVGSDGKAYFRDVLIGTGYVLEEVDTAIRYVIPENQTATIEWNKVTNKSFENILKKWQLTVTKSDSETGTAQGDATLSGAKYGIYKGDQLVDTYITDRGGQFTTKFYICDSDWSLREITPSEGYLLDPTVYHIGAEAKLYTVEYNSTALDVLETVQKGRIAVIKHCDDGETQIETPETGAEFEVYLKRSGSYGNAKESERDILVCDENGFAQSKDLPYGIYTVRQIKGWEGKELLPPFDVFVKEDGETYRYLINNANFEALIEIVKKDIETGKVIPASGIGFKVRNTDTDEYIVQHINYPTPVNIEIYYTDSTGKLMMPEALPYGNYEIIEQNTCYGYVLDASPVPFTVDGSKTVVTVEKHNIAQKGTITVSKSGEVFSSVTAVGGGYVDEDGNDVAFPNLYQPVYSVQGLAGAVYEITAAEDIVTLDGTLRYAKGEVVAEITTDADGTATSEPLYLGKFGVRETKAPHGMVISNEVHSVELTYAGQEISITETATAFYNERQKASVSLSKVMAQDERFQIGMNGEILSVQFGLFAAEDLTAADGSVIPADGLLEIVNCDENGSAVFTTDVPVGAKLYVKEIAVDSRYILSDEKYPVEFVYAGQEIADVEIRVNDGEAITNDLIYGNIKGLKIDRETEETIAGALFGLFRADTVEFTEETAVLTAKSQEDGIFMFQNIPYENWLIKELQPAESFLPNEEIYPVIVSEHEQLIEITVVNDRIPEIGTTATAEEEKQTHPNETITIEDEVEYKHLIPGKEYTLKGVLMNKATGELFIVNGAEVRSEITFVPTEPSGTVIVTFTFDGSGITENTDIVVFESLYKDGLELTVHADIEDDSQTVTVLVPEIGTSATVDGEKEFNATEVFTLDDVVTYENLIPGKEYTIKGVLMDKTTGEPLMLNGEEFRSEITFTPEKPDGEIKVSFTFDADGITTETEVVVFEHLFRDGVEIAVHADIEDDGQTVKITPPAPPVTENPKTGDNSNLGFWIGLGAIAFGGLISTLIIGIKQKKDDDDE